MTYPQWICSECGKKHGRPSGFGYATYHEPEPGESCGWCGSTTKPLTEPRDFSWPKNPHRIRQGGDHFDVADKDKC